MRVRTNGKCRICFKCGKYVGQHLLSNFIGKNIFPSLIFHISRHDKRIADVHGLRTVIFKQKMPAGMTILCDSACVSNKRLTIVRNVRCRKIREIKDVPMSTVLAAIDLVLQVVLPSEHQDAQSGVMSTGVGMISFNVVSRYKALAG